VNDHLQVVDKAPTALWQNFKQGDKKALSQIYYEHYSDLYTYGSKITKNTILVEDCIQDLFLVLWKSRERLGEVQSIKAYLFKSFRSKLFRVLKKHKTDALLPDFRTLMNMDFELSAEEMMIDQQSVDEQTRNLQIALNKLTNRQKEIMYLRFYKDLSYDEIAQIIPISYQSIRNSVHESVKMLRKYLLLLLLISLI
jgi:RNA polymerase sigma factor (sigma-70 family)